MQDKLKYNKRTKEIDEDLDIYFLNIKFLYSFIL